MYKDVAMREITEILKMKSPGENGVILGNNGFCGVTDPVCSR